MVRVADYIIDELVKKGIKHIFLLTGRGILYLTDAVAKNENIKGICTYHEQGASYAAMAYAAASDGLSACLISTGCAATNAVTAALCAYQDNLPIIFISGQHMLNETTRFTGMPIRTFGSQEADIISIIQSITKYSVMLTKVEDVADEINKAIIQAESGRKGPVWIDVPLDIQNARFEPNTEEISAIDNSSSNNLQKEDLEDVITALKTAKRPIVLVGGGAGSKEAKAELACFIEKNNLPIVFSTSGVDIYGKSHELSIGAIGSLGGTRAGNFAIQNADFVLAIGTKLCSQSTGDKSMFLREGKLCVVDIDQNEHIKNKDIISKLIICDAYKFLNEINKCDLNLACNEWVDKCKHWKKIFDVKNEEFAQNLIKANKNDLYLFASTLSERLPNDATVITDAGLEELIIPSTISFKEGQKCLFPAAQGAMGYAIPAIIGAHFAGRKNIITVVGDGSIMMNIQELQIIKANNIPVKIFVINNNMYSVIRKRQTDLFRTRTIGNDPSDGVPAPDFSKIADCFGFDYCNIGSYSELDNSIEKVIASPNPTICEVMSVEEQKYFHMSFAFNEKRKLVKRPLEDLSPFLDRELFKKEMVIKPIEE